MRFTINTDGPEMLRTTLRHEYDVLLTEGILDEESVRSCNELAHEVSFVRNGQGLAGPSTAATHQQQAGSR